MNKQCKVPFVSDQIEQFWIIECIICVILRRQIWFHHEFGKDLNLCKYLWNDFYTELNIKGNKIWKVKISSFLGIYV